MTPTAALIVEPPPPPPSNDVLQAARGTRQALADCGYFPRGTLDDYLESKARCSRRLLLLLTSGTATAGDMTGSTCRSSARRKSERQC
jgi:hypothetical protein